ncbi:helix-turn-helix transcriptional regulator [Nitratiruptor sp. YY09-18]|uniref:helix-turn-helix domain-containing protein n=1 Tax=Nitratiruptor sp. YY09-18 TaxID=2724901 RepID=UPI0019151545|nr:helix-turn-helix transcriptional regulator [Nitratiruptor sp. YY09-18]BCD68124.1 hypothetical protein NitYY0918_C1035 [Nitratiruptor sp. YY09-18]
MSFSYGQKIRELRQKFGLSQSELARKLGVHKQMVSDVERGKQKRFNPQIEQKLIELFDINPSWLHEIPQPSHPTNQQVATPSQIPLSQSEIDILMRYFAQIPPHNRLDALACILQCMSKFK